MPRSLDALRSSVDRLATLVAPLDDDAITAAAHPTERTIAQVCAHLGSGAEIHTARITAVLADRPAPDDLSERTRAQWDAKSPREMVDDALRADAALLERLSTIPPDQQADLHLPLGTMEVPYETFVASRLAEHVVRGWDVAEALDPGAALSADGLDIVLVRTLWLASFAARPAGEARTITIATSEPEEAIAVVIRTDDVEVETGVAIPPVDLMMPTESFVRLVHGRLDPLHTPPAVVAADAALLDQLRAVFAGR
jgi:uncharacterized protein (TIGR03083 family)